MRTPDSGEGVRDISHAEKLVIDSDHITTYAPVLPISTTNA